MENLNKIDSKNQPEGMGEWIEENIWDLFGEDENDTESDDEDRMNEKITVYKVGIYEGSKFIVFEKIEDAFNELRDMMEHGEVDDKAWMRKDKLTRKEVSDLPDFEGF